MSCSGVAIGDVSEESSQEKLQLPPRWWQALEGGGRMEQREMFVPHLFPSCFPETERSWVPSEQHPTLIAAVEREACSVFSVPHGEDSLAEVGEDVKSMESFPNFALVLGAAGSQRHSRGSCRSTMPATPEGGQDQSVASSSSGWIIECVQTCQLGQPWAKWP